MSTTSHMSHLVSEIAIDEIKLPPTRLRRLQPDVISALAQSLQEVGLLHPILVDESGQLIAGLHRVEAARHLGWAAINAVIVEDRSADLMRMMEIDENLARADLSPAERAAHQAERKAIYEREFPQTRHGGDRGNQHTGGKPASRHGGELADRYTETAAKTQGTSERTVQREVTRGAAIPNVASLAGTALDKEGELDALVKLPEPQRCELMQRARAGEKVSAKTTLKALVRDNREIALAEKTASAAIEIGRNLYGVIMADPPWRFEPWSRETGMDRAADNHYPTMDLDAIKALSVPAAPDCVLFLWATPPMLPQALEVMCAWGFEYRSHCIWLKERTGTGYWFRSQHELLLVGTRGGIPAPAPGTQSPSVIEAPTGRHSEKPTVFAEMIERLFPTLPKLEMFARQKRAGWDVWGNEA